MKIQVVPNDMEFGFTLGVRAETYIEIEEDIESERNGFIIGFMLFDIIISVPINQ